MARCTGGRGAPGAVSREAVRALEAYADHYRPKPKREPSSSGGGCGCLSLVVFCLLIWALLFGVTVNGTHYGITCSMARGVEVSP